MNRKKINNCTKNIEISESLELLISNSNTTISFNNKVKSIYISSLINCNLTFKIKHNITILFFHNMGDSQSNIKIKLVKLNTRVLIREICLTAQQNEYNKNLELIHEAKNTFSDYKFFGFAIDKSKLRISVLSKIYKGMSKSETHQMINIITDNDARGEGQPGLLIDDFDVKASHGNSIGQVSSREIYYLQTKGINKKNARWIIVRGCIKNILSILDKHRQDSIINNIKHSLRIEGNNE